MPNDAVSRLERLFHAVLELPVHERRAFLESECGDDRALLADVESLVRAEAEADDSSYERWPAAAAAAWAGLASSTGAPSGPFDPVDLAGATIDHYTIHRRLGAGGMGEVFLAHDDSLGRLVAVKTLPRRLSEDSRRLERFRIEARAASALNHPNVAAIHALGESEGLPFIVMEYVEGQSLADLLRDGPLPAERAFDYARQIAHALDEAHRAGITHRDIKPANVMLTPRGVAKVLDFGLAKLPPEAGDAAHSPAMPAPSASVPGLVLGTVHYMSPEQALGRPIDGRSDLFSLGVVLYELLTGCLPFDGASMTATIDALLHSDPLPPSQRRAGLDPAVDRVAARALAKAPEARYQTAQAFIADLEALERRESPPHAPAARPRLLERRGARLAGAALAIGIVAAGAGLWQWRSETAPPPMAVPVTSFAGTETTPAFSPDGQTLAYTWDGPDRQNPDIYLQPLGGAPRRLTHDPAYDTHPAFSPDGRLIAFVRGRTRLFLVARDGGPERELGSVGDPRVSFTADGAFVAATSSRHPGLALFPLEGGGPRPLTRPPAGSTDIAPVFSPDGRRLAFQRIPTTSVSDVWVANADGSGAQRLTFDDRSLEGPVWTADGRGLVFSSGRLGAGRLWFVSAAGGAPEPLPDTGPGATMPTIPRVGGRLAFVSSLEDTNIWQIALDDRGAAAGTAQLTPTASTWLDGAPDVSPDGRWLAFASNRSGRDEIWVGELNGVAARQITSFVNVPASTVGSPRWSPDGARLAFDARIRGNADIYLVAASGGTPQRLTSDAGADVVPSWSRDGAWIYFTSRRGGRPEVWRLPVAGGVEQRVTDTGAFGAQESLDGAFLVYGRDRVYTTLWRRPTGGGAETPALVDETGRSRIVMQFASWRPTHTGIVFLEETPDRAGRPGVQEHVLQSFDTATRRVSPLVTLGAMPTMASGGIALTPDFGRLLFSQRDAQRSDIVLLEPWR